MEPKSKIHTVFTTPLPGGEHEICVPSVGTFIAPKPPKGYPYGGIQRHVAVRLIGEMHNAHSVRRLISQVCGGVRDAH